MIEKYKGSRWYKCDLHLHTVNSKCFYDQSVTAEQWVERALEQGLDCVAVTDHNTGIGVDEIKVAAKGTKLTVFPGVEITCDSSKVHLLALFDVDKTSDDVNDFLIKCSINRDNFGEQNTSTSKSIFEIVKLANEEGALVIPAHIDEYNGLGAVSVANLETFFGLENINAVQVVHKEFLDVQLQLPASPDLKAYLNDYYNNPSPNIDDSKIKEWFTAVKYASNSNLAILTFSDNPHEPKNPKHGLAGIGCRSTWIKMDEKPTLEGLRLAFLLPQSRVKNDFDNEKLPYNLPDLWFNSVSIRNTAITNTSPVKIEFNPQLNTIIGGRGSGKSSILRFIRGVFNRTSDLIQLQDILNDHNDFYKRQEDKTKKGVITQDTIIEIEFYRNEILYRITASEIVNSESQKIKIEKRNSLTETWEEINEEAYIDFFEFEHYSQKQIYEIAQEPNALRERIDRGIKGVKDLKTERTIIKGLFLEKSASIRSIQQQISNKGKLNTELKDLNDSIILVQQSGVNELTNAKQNFESQKEIINKFFQNITIKQAKLQEIIDNFALQDIDYSEFTSTETIELQKTSKIVVDGLENVKNELIKQKKNIEKLIIQFEEAVQGSNWKTNYDKNNATFNQKKAELEAQGIFDIGVYEQLTIAKSAKEEELQKIVALEEILAKELQEKIDLRDRYLRISKEITKERQEFVKETLNNSKIKISIKPFRNRIDLIQQLRKIIQRDETYQADIDYLTSICFNGNVEKNITEVREAFYKLKRGEHVLGITGFFENLVIGLNDAQLDEIDMLFPEDEIEIEYMPSGSTVFKSLTTASAGQKTTAILTFILSYGKIPLILDQPEDDLDNRLVYELIVDRLKQAKNQRQIIVVTHNANIPVNGDAEYIVSMNSDSKLLEILYTGTIEQARIKKEICDVMEGSEQAFEMRYKRYHQTN